MSPEDPQALAVALAVVEALEELDVAYHLGGSYASSIHGVPRQTHDVDLVVFLDLARLRPFVTRLSDDFYLDVHRAAQAIEQRVSFNLVHLETGVKVDLFVSGASEFESEEQRRSVDLSIADRTVRVKAPEDTVLRKLLWYREGGEVSDRQWSDVLGILRVQAARLDRAHLHRWAERLGVGGLLDRALEQAR